MLSGSSFWRLFLGSGGIVASVSLALGLVVLRWEERHLLDALSDRLQQVSSRVSPAAAAAIEDANPGLLWEIAQPLARDAGLRITVVRPHGEVVFDSEGAADRVENLGTQPEIRAALSTGRGSDRRLVAATGIEMLFFAERLADVGRPVGVVRIGAPLGRVTSVLATARRWNWAAAGVGLLAALVWSAHVASQTRRPLAELTRAARALAEGDYRQQTVRHRGDELGKFAEEFDRLRRELAAQIEELRQHNERLASVLGSMIEGVLAIDDRERILFANLAARNLLDFATPDAVGRPLLEAVRHRAVVDIARQALRTHQPAKSEFTLPGANRRVLSVSASRLPGNPHPGVLLVLHDVSDLRRLEALRQEFVANVSHELKTPLTAIKAYAETLLEGALRDSANNEGFVRRIAEQADRLHQLILDMLSIARIESGEKPFEIAVVDVGKLVHCCVENHAAAAEARNVRLATNPPETPVRARADEEGVRQILDNLIDNAIKYTLEGGRVTVHWSAAESLARIQVEDTGIGIAPDDQARIFERFFRVDRARSRELGGTGLGLSIVKHLSQSFGGGVSVRSEVGRGSTFSVWLPLA